MKKIMAIFLLFYISTSVAEAITDHELKIVGRSLANYELCSDISSELEDKAMFHYYREMYNDSLRDIKAYQTIQREIIINEQQKSAIKLAKIDRKNFGEFCLSRFDLLSRKMQEKKLVGK